MGEAAVPMRPGRDWRSIVRKDVPAGLVNAVISVPDGLASAALAGVNPVYGLYTSVVAPIGGSLLVSTQLMQIATTSASALAAGQAIAAYPGAQRAEAMFLLVLMVGVFLALFGVLRLGRLSRFVSHSVMTGFLSGVAAVLVMDQLAPLVGYQPSGGNELVQLADLVAHVGRFDIATLLVGLGAIAILLGMRRTRFAAAASLVALVLPSLAVAVFGLGSVTLIDDVSPIPRGMPSPALPNLTLLGPQLVGAAAAVAVIIGIQGIGVSQGVRNPDGTPNDASKDLVAQGVANAASGLFSGIPAGGSVGQTALNVAVGARSRWAGVAGGVWMLAIVLIFPGLVGQVPMTVLAALMIMAGVGAIDMGELRSVWRTGIGALLPMVATFAATLVLPIPVAVGIGVVLTLLLFVVSSANDVSVRVLSREPDGRIHESDPPASLPSRATTVLEVYGSLFFAGARRFEEQLPDPAGAVQPAVVIRLRGRQRLGATLIEVLDIYSEAVERAGGRLYLAGLSEDAASQLQRSGKLDPDRRVDILRADDALGTSTARAVDMASAWLANQHRRNDP
ncbi:SulP family inorganic anion transporter [Aerolutibacter ruishenii]|uniref:SulP family sulfate permease n=1 Tax=Aerolutibacter ruishenii TaxID=686800 RepID=A0A562LD75_9GAMM|nr:SulP family inorganic anion transporter [Lysobacter ruishenii]TWI05394.1 SulP family sulfate permease [Lysobacter ruishenii]